MPRVKRTYLDGAARLRARKAVVVAKREAFRFEMVHSMNYEHIVADNLHRKKTERIILHAGRSRGA